MEMRRENPRDFNIEVRQERQRATPPHVLDLRVRSRKNRKKRKQNITRRIILQELAGIESHDVELASSLGISLTADDQTISQPGPQALLAQEHLAAISRFAPADWQEEASELSPESAPPRKSKAPGSYGVRAVRNFAFLAGSIAVILLGSFFFQKGFVLKNEGVARSMDAYSYLRDAEAALASLDFEEASDDFAKAYENLVVAEGALQEIGGLTVSIVENIPLDSRPASSIALLRAAKHTARAGEMITSALAILSPQEALSAGGFFAMLSPDADTGQSAELLSAFGVFRQALVSAEQELVQAQYEIERVEPDDFPDEFQESIEGLRRKIPSLVALSRNLKEYSDISALLLGQDSPKRYLVLFQNSSELRPTGGFIGSYALLEIAEGKLENVLVEGIYNIDGQLTVNVVPPEPFQHIATAWSTHDANWFLDFPTSAEKIRWFYEKTGGGKVDGVLTLNVEVIEQLLALTGPIALEGYDLVLDAQNFRDEIQYEVEVAYDKKLNRPKQVLADFTPLFLERLFQIAETSHADIASLVLRALEQKYIMLYFQDRDAQKFFEKQRWAGKIQSQIRQSAEGTPNDFLAVVHSNIGGHKTDKFMEDKVDYDVEVREDGSVFGRVTITRTHTGGDTAYWWYNRSNIDYLKIYVPEGSELISTSGGKRREVENPADYAALRFSEDLDVLAMESRANKEGAVDVFSESGQRVFGTWLVTNAKNTTQFEVYYKLPFQVEFQNGVARYNVYMQKQPGTAIAADLTVDIPDAWEVVWDNSEPNKLKGPFVLDTDKVMGYILKK